MHILILVLYSGFTGTMTMTSSRLFLSGSAVEQVLFFTYLLFQCYHSLFQFTWGEMDEEFAVESIYFALVLAQLLASLFSDTSAITTPESTLLEEERIPLLGKSDSNENILQVSMSLSSQIL